MWQVGGMPRIPRLSIAGVPLHVVQRGNNRQPVFFSEEDYRDYLRRLFDGAARYDVSVHAFVCMTNHVHLLLTPWQDRAASRMMQWLGSGYTAAVNATYHRTGSLWEGRFKSSLVDSGRYLMACYRYIELNPVRARMVVRRTPPPACRTGGLRAHEGGAGADSLRGRQRAADGVDQVQGRGGAYPCKAANRWPPGQAGQSVRTASWQRHSR